MTRRIINRGTFHPVIVFILSMFYCVFSPLVTTVSAQITNYIWVEKNNGLSSWNIVGIEIDHQDPTILYALTRFDGVYKSTNSGNSWVRKMQGTPEDAQSMYAHLFGNLMTMDPVNSSILYTNFDGQVYVTYDGAENWININAGINSCIDNYQVAGVVIDPQDTQHLFAAHVATSCTGGIFESLNGGSTWTQIAGSLSPSNPPMSNDAWTLAIDPTDNQRLYSSTVYKSFMYSLDGGHLWTLNSPLNAGSNGTVVIVHPTVPSRIILGHSEGMHVSTDYGLTWTDLTYQVPGYVYDINVARSNSSIVYAVSDCGLFKSETGGLSWFEIGNYSDLSLISVAIHPTNTSTIYLTSAGNGVFRSHNGGVSLNEMNVGLPMTIHASSVAVAPDSPNIYYVAIYGRGFYRSMDRGESWTLMNNSLNLTRSMYIAVDPFEADTVWAGFDYLSKSIDGGLTWTADDYIADHTFTDLKIHNADPSRVFAVSSPYPDPNRIYKSVDYGENWQVKLSYASRISGPIIIDSVNPQNIYVASYNYLKKSTDMGETWTTITSGLTTNVGDNHLDGLAIDPVENNIVYVTTRSDRIFKSLDYGLHFFELTELGSYPGKIIIDQEDHLRLYVCSLYSWYRSDDGGVSWTELSTQGINSSVKRLSPTAFQDPLNPQRFITGDYSQGVLVGENYVPDFQNSQLSVWPTENVTIWTYLTFTNTVVNSGLQAAADVTMEVTVPAGCAWRTNSLLVNGEQAPENWSNEVLEVTLGTIDIGQVVQVQYQFQAVACETFQHSTLIKSESDVFVQDTITNTVTVQVICRPEFSLSNIEFMDLNGRSLIVGDTLGVRFYLRNKGLVAATNAVFRSIISPPATYIPDSTMINGEFPMSDPYFEGTLTIPLGTIPVNNIPLEVSYLNAIGYCSPVIHDVTITSDEHPEGYVFENLVSEVYCPDLSASTLSVIDDNGGKVKPGDTLTYTLSLQNTSSSLSHYVQIYVAVPVDLIYIENSFHVDGVTVSPDPETNGLIVYTVGMLDAGTTMNLSYQTEIKSKVNTGTVISSSAHVSSWEDIGGNTIGPVSVTVGNRSQLIQPVPQSKSLETLTF